MADKELEITPLEQQIAKSAGITPTEVHLAVELGVTPEQFMNAKPTNWRKRSEQISQEQDGEK